MVKAAVGAGTPQLHDALFPGLAALGCTFSTAPGMFCLFHDSRFHDLRFTVDLPVHANPRRFTFLLLRRNVNRES